MISKPLDKGHQSLFSFSKGLTKPNTPWRINILNTMNHEGLVQMIFRIAKCVTFTGKNSHRTLSAKIWAIYYKSLTWMFRQNQWKSMNIPGFPYCSLPFWILAVHLSEVKVKGASTNVIPRPGKTQVSKQAPKAKAKAKAKAQNDKMKDWHFFWGMVGWMLGCRRGWVGWV